MDRERVWERIDKDDGLTDAEKRAEYLAEVDDQEYEEAYWENEP